MANRRFIDFPIASSVGDNDIVLIWQDGLNKQTTKGTLIQGAPTSLEGLTDVDIAGLINGQILQYNSVTGKWENVDRTDINLSQLGDVSIVSPSNGQVLVYNSSTSKWENSSAGYVPYVGAVTTVDLGAQTIQAGSFVKAGGTAAQFLKANGSVDSNTYLTTGSAAATYVPYTGATADVNLGTHDLTAERGTFQNNGSSDTLTVNHTSGSGKGINVSKGGNGEALLVTKTSGSGNAMAVVGGRTALVDLSLSSVSNATGNFLTISGGVVHQRTPSETRSDVGAQAQLNGTGFVKASGTTISYDNSTYQVTSEKGQPNGYASLDSNGKVPLVQINDALIGNVNFQGLWNAATNTPTLANPPASDTKGHYYIVSTAGTFASISFEVGDWIISDGTAWGKVDNTDAVSSVFGRTGNVTAANGDYTTAQVTESGNLYYTDGRARGAISLTTTGASGSSTYNNSTGVLNVPTYTLSGLGGIGGTIAAGQVAFGTAANTIGGDADFTYNSTTNLLTVGGPIRYLAGAQSNPTGGASLVIDFQTTGGNLARIRSRDWDGAIWQDLRVESLNFIINANGTERWRINNTGILQSNGAQTIRTSTGNLTLATNGGNGNIVLTPHGTGDVGIGVTNMSSFFNQASNLVIGNTGNVGLTIYSSTGGNNVIAFADVADAINSGFNAGGCILYVHSDNSMRFRVNGAERFSIASTGNLLINTTTNAGFRLDVNGTARVQGNLNVSTGGVTLTGAQTIQTSTGNLTLTSADNTGIVDIRRTDRVLGAELRLTNSFNGSGYLAGDIIGTLNFFTSDTTGIGPHSVANITAVSGGVNSASPDGNLVFSTGGYNVAASEKWRIASTGVLQSNGAQTIQTSTGNLTLATGGGNADININPNGTGKVGVNTATEYAKFQVTANTATTIPALGTTNDSAAFAISTQTSTYGLLSGVQSTGNVWMQAQRFTGAADAFNLLLQPRGGNLLVGTTTDAGFRLDVNGTGRFKVSTDRNLALRFDTNITLSAQSDTGGPESLRIYADTFRLFTSTTAAGLTERLTISNTGAATFKVSTDRNLSTKFDTQITLSAQSDSGAPESLRVYSDTFRVYTATTAVGLTERLSISNTGAATFSASVSTPHTTKSANYTLDASDYTVGFDCASNRTANLPDATTCAGRIYVIYQYNTNIGLRYVTIDGNGSQTINGLTTVNLQYQDDFSSVMIQSNGSNWVVIASALYAAPV
jgi:hypothetical protein